LNLFSFLKFCNCDNALKFPTGLLVVDLETTLSVDP
jgi:hypothetical protein